MKSKLLAIAVLGLGLIGSSTLSAQQYVIDKMDLSVFPKAEKGYQQYVIEVPHSTLEEDGNKKVEVYVGKYTQVDKCNRHFLSGEIITKDLKGYGYNYYEFKTNGTIAGTMMGCGESGTVTKFVTAQPILKDYNGRMPIVIYVPEGYDVQYKIYKADSETYRAAQVRTKK